MKKHDNPELLRGIFGVAYLLCRIASKKRGHFADFLEFHGISLLNAGYDEDEKVLEVLIHKIEIGVRLFGAVGSISAEDSEVLLNELSELHTLCKEIQQNDGASSLKNELVRAREIINNLNHQNTQRVSVGGVLPSEERVESSSHIKNRQSAMIEAIKRMGSCKMRDFQELLKETSERTIRYDLQNLISKGAIERIGNGGPATFYRLPIADKNTEDANKIIDQEVMQESFLDA